jgi:hypothetical protein
MPSRVNRPPEQDAEFLRERAGKLRMIAAGMPPSVESQLLHVAYELEKRAAALEARRFESGVEALNT